MRNRIKIRINLDSLKKALARFLWQGGEKFFPAFLVALLLAVLITLLVFWSSMASLQKTSIGLESKVRFRQELFRKVAAVLEERTKRFQDVDAKEYPDIFAPFPE